MKILHDTIKRFRSNIFAEYLTMFFIVALIFTVVLVMTNKSGREMVTSQKTTLPFSSSESIFDTASSSESDNSFSVWDPETASSKKYASYEDIKREFEEKRKKDLEEYNKAIKGTIVEQIQNASIPSYDDENQLAQLQQGEIFIKEPASDEFPNGINLWAANIEKNKNSFVAGDFDKDGLDDVAHIIVYTGFGSGYFYQLTIFINDHGKLKYLTQEELGDRVVIKSVKYNSGLFTVDMITQGEGEDFMGFCCPNVSTTIRFQLKNRLVEI